jgi:ADP-ribose pyrophosphatase YjhB (NUDIX family)
MSSTQPDTIVYVTTEFEIRYTVRVLLVDHLDRLLLFHGQDPANLSDVFWCPVGGGVETGESPEQAAMREVREGTGLSNLELGPHIWNGQEKYNFNGTKRHAIETWFFARVAHLEIDTSGFSEIELKSFIEYRWWTQAELSTTSETLTPRRLASLFHDLLLNGTPKVPIELGLEDHSRHG